MRYLEDMYSKYGFSYGGSIPPDAEAARGLYVEAINHFAELHGSAWRAVAFDRPGMRNWCMILVVPKEDAALTPPNYDRAVSTERLDEEWNQAVDDAQELMLDQECLVVNVTVDRGRLFDLLHPTVGRRGQPITPTLE